MVHTVPPSREDYRLTEHVGPRMTARAALQSESWSARGEMTAQVHDRYGRALGDANALDFDDLLLRSVELFATAETVKGRYAERFRFIMVDEYQDTNQPQYLLIRHLADDRRY